jgi:hypothetical protein
MKNIMVRLILISLVFIVIGVVTRQSDAQTALKAIVGVWPLDGTAIDASLKGHDGEIKGSPQWVTGKFGKALDFLGTKGNFILIPHDASLNLTKFTMTAWVKVRGNNPAGWWQSVIVKTAGWDMESYVLFIHPSNGTAMVSIVINKTWTNLPGKKVLSDENWHHLAGTYDMSNMRLYVDGDLDAQMSNTQKPVANDGPLAIGADEIAAGGNEVINGAVSDVGLFNDALDEKEIENIMKVGLLDALGLTAVSPKGKLAAAWGALKAAAGEPK